MIKVIMDAVVAVQHIRYRQKRPHNNEALSPLLSEGVQQRGHLIGRPSGWWERTMKQIAGDAVAAPAPHHHKPYSNRQLEGELFTCRFN